MKVHKVTLMIIDTGQLGAAEVREVIENTRYPNHCIAPSVMAIETREVDWNDGEHPINYNDQCDAAFAELFKQPALGAGEERG